jgi:hypothetical protein
MNDENDRDEASNSDAYLELADRAQHRFDQRREYEWKINFGLWAALGLALGFVLSNDSPISVGMKVGASIVLTMIVAVYLYWIANLHVRAFLDRDTSVFWEEQRIKLLPVQLPDTLKPNFKPITKYWVPVSQFGYTALLASMLALAIWLRPSVSTSNGKILIEGNGPSRIVIDPATRTS